MYLVIIIAAAIVAAAIAVGITVVMQRRNAQSRAKLIITEAERQAEDLKRDKVLEGREEALKIISDAEKQETAVDRSQNETARAATQLPAERKPAHAQRTRYPAHEH